MKYYAHKRETAGGQIVWQTVWTHLLGAARRAAECLRPVGLENAAYLAALLHDIGRCEEYASGKSHHEAGAKLARPILLACGYTEEECAEICDAIGRHKAPSEQARSLATLLYDADKQSRNCFDCSVQEQCYWSEEKKNHTIRY